MHYRLLAELWHARRSMKPRPSRPLYAKTNGARVDSLAQTSEEPAKAVRRLFGTDGIRAVANEPPMTPELALTLGRAVTYVAGRGKKHAPRVLIGKDTRL